MKTKFLVFLLVVFTFAISASASTIAFQSGDGVGESVDVPHLAIVGGPTVVLSSVPAVWGTLPGASWVSYDQTGLNGIVAPNTNDVNSPTTIFHEDLFLPYGNNTGSATFGADDTMAVYIINSLYPGGYMLKAANWVQDATCAAGPIACEQAEFLTIDLTPYLAQGNNKLDLWGYQKAGYSSGALWKGSIESVPEPGTVALVGFGLLAAGIFHRRRSPSSKS